MPSITIIIIILVMNIVSMYGVQPDYDNHFVYASLKQKFFEILRHQKSLLRRLMLVQFEPSSLSLPPNAHLIRKKLNNPSLPIPPSVSAG